MYRTLFGFVFLVLCVVPSTRGRCTPAPETQKTSWGLRLFVDRSEPVKAMRGMVVVAQSGWSPPQEGVLVEVYDHPEIALRDPSPNRVGQKRLAACITGKDGKFSFALPPGTYELRASGGDGWDATCIVVEVRKHGAKLKELEVDIRLSH